MSSGSAGRKAIDTARAELALAGGFTLHELPGGRFLVTRWGLCRECADLDALRALLTQLGRPALPVPAA